MKLNRTLRIHPAAVSLLENSKVADELIAFLVDLEDDPGVEGRSILYDAGSRRIEATQIGDICVGYDLHFIVPPVYPCLSLHLCREIHVWEIAKQGYFADRWDPPSTGFGWAWLRNWLFGL